MTSPDENRVSTRATINTRGRVVLSSLDRARNVVIRDLSLHGANLCVGDWEEVPGEFFLLIRWRMRPQELRQSCTRRWRVGNVVGVRFGEGLPENVFCGIIADAALPGARDIQPGRFAVAGLGA